MSLAWDSITSGVGWTDLKKIKYILDCGQASAIRLTGDSEFHKLIKLADGIDARIKLANAALKAISKKPDTGKIVVALKKVHELWNTHFQVSWELCQRVFEVIGKNKDARVKVNIDHPEKNKIRQYVAEFLKYIATPNLPALSIHHLSKGAYKEGHQRSYYEEDEKAIYYRDSVTRGLVFHELGHAIEHLTPGLSEAALAYLNYRTDGKPVKLNNIGHPYHRPDESVKLDKFVDVYFGKLYPDGTELISMGLQMLVTDPARLYNDDHEMFLFAIGSIKAARTGLPWK